MTNKKIDRLMMEIEEEWKAKKENICVDCGRPFTREYEKEICLGCEIHKTMNRFKASKKKPKRKTKKRSDEYILRARLSTMKNRCNYPKSSSFHNYGGRGISVCEAWSNNSNAFVSWAIEAGFKQELYIDRINNDGDYEPSNCRWVTPAESNKNKRKYKML